MPDKQRSKNGGPPWKSLMFRDAIYMKGTIHEWQREGKLTGTKGE